MAYYRINGGKRLEGAVTISGAKNAALAIIPAVILSGESCLLENLPEIEDVRIVEEILASMGADISRTPDGSMRIDPSGINTFSVTGEMVSSMRASYYLLGALLGRYKKAEIALPGGCAIGQRPIDQHIKGMRALGADIVIQGGSVKARADKLKGAEIYLDVVSVGATINIMLAAVAAEGQTIIANAAKEPHVVDVANFLNMMGANVKGAGTDVIRIQGGRRLHGCTYAVIPDQIEAGTFMIAAAATRGDVIINNVIPTHLEAISAKLMESGVTVSEGALSRLPHRPSAAHDGAFSHGGGQQLHNGKHIREPLQPCAGACKDGGQHFHKLPHGHGGGSGKALRRAPLRKRPEGGRGAGHSRACRGGREHHKPDTLYRPGLRVSRAEAPRAGRRYNAYRRIARTSTGEFT